MKKTRLLALLAALCAGAAMPAIAQPGYGSAQPGYDSYGSIRPGWDRVGSVDFSFRPDHETQYGAFGGRVEQLMFRRPQRVGRVR